MNDEMQIVPDYEQLWADLLSRIYVRGFIMQSKLSLTPSRRAKIDTYLEMHPACRDGLPRRRGHQYQCQHRREARTYSPLLSIMAIGYRKKDNGWLLTR